jgi:hypothetical protein
MTLLLGLIITQENREETFGNSNIWTYYKFRDVGMRNKQYNSKGLSVEWERAVTETEPIFRTSNISNIL